MDRQDLEQTLGVSKPTVHRLTCSLGERELIVRVDGLFKLTPLGEIVAEGTRVSHQLGEKSTSD